jgi:putative multiple sugar transport system substrate-binding protein
MKKLLALTATALFVFAACSSGGATTAPQSAAPGDSAAPAESAAPAGSPAAGAGGLVGIAMPTKSSARWISDGDNLVASLTELGYETDLQYAEDDIPTQVSQVENMITKGAKVLVIAAIDGTTLTDTLQKAADAGIKVFAYDRLIRDSPNVDYYAAFDNYDVGVAQANSIIETLDLNNAAGPFNIELFAGSPDDNNAGFFFNGAWDTLKPFIDSGKLVVKSGETEFPNQIGTLRWSGEAAQARMDNILATHYADGRVDAVLSPYDGISRGIIASLKQVGYYTADNPGPVVTGQDAEEPSVKSILADEQTSTVFKDTRTLAAKVAEMVNQFLAGETVDVNDTETYDNGVKVVPSYLLPVVNVTKDTVQKELVDTGYYTAEQLGL